MLTAIFMLLLLGGLAVLTLSYARLHAQFFADSYNKEQAQIFMQSALEAALMRIEANRSDLHFLSHDGRFEADVEVERCYIYEKSEHNNSNCTPSNTTAIQTPQSNGYMLLRITVQSRPDPKILTPIRITQRSLQRP